MPGNVPGNVEYFVDRREALLRARSRPRAATRRASRSPASSNVRAEPAGLREARETALRFVAAGADARHARHPGARGPAALAAMAREVAEPVRERGRPGLTALGVRSRQYTPVHVAPCAGS